MRDFFNKIPLWLINAISVISGLLAIFDALLALIFLYKGWENSDKLIGVVLCLFIFILAVRVRKYKKIDFERHQAMSFVYHKLTHDSRDLFFDIMKRHKGKEGDDVSSLCAEYKSKLSAILTHLCDMMEVYCGQKVSSCIKLITRPNVNFEEITLTTFCRSNTSDTDRGLYENKNKEIKLSDNTDFSYIVDPSNDYSLNYFYQGNLKQFDKELRKQNKQYKNSNPNWEKDYNATIVVPIQIENSRRYDSRNDKALHVIGFLCIDSKSTSAFLQRQKTFNVNMMKSFADILYILLSQYKHYVELYKKLLDENNA